MALGTTGREQGSTYKARGNGGLLTLFKYRPPVSCHGFELRRRPRRYVVAVVQSVLYVDKGKGMASERLWDLIDIRYHSPFSLREYADDTLHIPRPFADCTVSRQSH